MRGLGAVLLALLVGCAGDDARPPGQDDPRVWLRTWGDINRDEAWGVDHTADGDLVVASFRARPAQLDGYVTRLSPEGAEVWETRLGEGLDERLLTVVVDGDVVRAGGRAYLAEEDLSRSSAWLVELTASDGTVLDDVRDNASGGVDSIEGITTAGGRRLVSGEAGGDAMVLALDDGGDVEDRLEWGVPEDWDEAHGDLVVLGDLVAFAGRAGGIDEERGGDAVIVGVDPSDLSERWVTSFGLPSRRDVLLGLTTDGEALFGVGTAEEETGNFGDELLLVSVTTDGSVRWERRLPGPATGRAIRVDPSDGTLWIAATRDGDLWLLHLDPTDGRTLDEHTWGGSEEEAFHDLLIDGDHAVLAGRTWSTGAGKDDALVVSFDLRGPVFPPL